MMKDKIIEQYEQGNIVLVQNWGDLRTIKLDDFINQDADSMLYDLNMNERIAIELENINDPRWVYNYAVTKTIRALKARIEELEKQ